MIINKGEKVHIIRRRNFIDDLRRHFVGEVEEVDGHIARVGGYVFVFDSTSNTYVKKAQRRTTINNLGDSGYIVNIIPADVDIKELVYKTVERRLIVTDVKSFFLDINEFGVGR